MNRPHHVHLVRVAYVDTDAAGVVHHATYLRYFEAARTEFLRAHGWDYARWMATSGLGLPVAENTVKYRAPARFDELLHVDTWVSKGTRACLDWKYKITRDGVLLTEGHTRTPCTTLEGHIRRVPVDLLRACLGAAFDPDAI